MNHLILVTCTILFTQCTQSDVDFDPLDDHYSLSNIICECDPKEIVEYQQQWFFDFNTSVVDVRAFGDLESNLILETGSYEFELIVDGIMSPYDSTDLFRVGGWEFGFSRNEGLIALSSGAPSGLADLPVYIFTKN